MHQKVKISWLKRLRSDRANYLYSQSYSICRYISRSITVMKIIPCMTMRMMMKKRNLMMISSIVIISSLAILRLSCLMQLPMEFRSNSRWDGMKRRNCSLNQRKERNICPFRKVKRKIKKEKKKMNSDGNIKYTILCIKFTHYFSFSTNLFLRRWNICCILLISFLLLLIRSFWLLWKMLCW